MSVHIQSTKAGGVYKICKTGELVWILIRVYYAFISAYVTKYTGLQFKQSRNLGVKYHSKPIG